MSTPIVLIPADMREVGDFATHTVGDKYARAVAEMAGATPLLLPAIPEIHDFGALFQVIDGVLLTGSLSNVHPLRYGETPDTRYEPYDKARDSVTFPLIEAIIQQDLPVLALCRGFQELNVALGGTLHPKLHELPGKLDHRKPEHPDRDVQYGPKHAVTFAPGSQFARLAGREEIMVNSIHSQGLDKIGAGVIVEGVAPDATPEAIRIDKMTNFALGVQWHPEYKPAENEFSTKLFGAFGKALHKA